MPRRSKGDDDRVTAYLHLTAILLILLLAELGAADSFNKLVGPNKLEKRQNGWHHSGHQVYEIPNFKVDNPIIDDTEDFDTMDEPHPADELLQTQDADGSKSYILGGY